MPHTIQDYDVRLIEQYSRECQPLLLAQGKNFAPIGNLTERTNERTKDIYKVTHTKVV
jgi:hypothetical protein